MVSLAVMFDMRSQQEDGAVEGLTGAESLEIASALHQEQVKLRTTTSQKCQAVPRRASI